MVAKTPESYTEGPFIIFNSVRKSNFCTGILIKLRPLAIARTSLICALMLLMSDHMFSIGDSHAIPLQTSFHLID